MADPALANALVVFIDPDTGRIVAGGVTDAEGRLRTKVPRGTWEMWVCKEGYMVYKTTVTVEETLSLDVSLAEIPRIYIPVLERTLQFTRKVTSEAIAQSASVTSEAMVSSEASITSASMTGSFEVTKE